MSLRRLAAAAAGSFVPLVWRALREPRLMILMYHRVLPSEHPDAQLEQAGMIITPASLRMHLQSLKGHFEFVHLDDWLERRRQGLPLPRLACAVTFDDGWLDNYQYAWPVLRELEVPSTLYLVSDFVDSDAIYWPTQLGRSLLGGDLQSFCSHVDPQLRAIAQRFETLLLSDDISLRREGVEAVIGECKKMPDEVLLREARTLRNAQGAGASGDIVSWAQVAEMGRGDLMRFGSHTRTHLRLGTAPDEAQVRREVVESRAILEQRTGRPVKTFCYPNGETSPLARRLVAENYLGAVTTEQGWNAPASDPCDLERIAIHEDISSTRNAFFARVANVL